MIIKEVKSLVELQELKHKHKMEEIEFERKCFVDVEFIKFDHQLQLQRIRSADIKRTQDRKVYSNWDYTNDKGGVK